MTRSPAKHPLALELLILLLSLFALAINLFLGVRGLLSAGAGIAGCGGGDCAEVLASRWAVVLWIPVPVLGVLAYFGLMLSLTERFHRGFVPLLGLIAGAAFWFVFVQAVILKKFCPWCMTAHAVGIGVVLLGCVMVARHEGFSRTMNNLLLWMLVAFLGIGLAQVYGPVPASHRILESSLGPPVASVHARGSGRKVVFDGGRKSFDVSTLPRRGRESAGHVMIEYFDYQCAACRTMAGYIDALVEKHPEQIAVILLPVPLDRACNDHVPAGGEHPGSCEITRLALAVWRVKPDAFPEFHRTLIADASLATARRLALEIMSANQLAAAVSDPWIDELIVANLLDLRVFSAGIDKLPKLLVRDRRILHGLPSGEADFIRVMEQELAL